MSVSGKNPRTAGRGVVNERSGRHNGLVHAIRAFAATVESFTSAECVAALARGQKEVGRALPADVRRGRLYAFGSTGHGKRRYTMHKHVMDAYYAQGGREHYKRKKRVMTRETVNSPRQRKFIDALRTVRQATTIELAPLIGETGRITSNLGARLVEKGLVWSRQIHGRFFVYFATAEDAEAFVPPPRAESRKRIVPQEPKLRIGKHQVVMLELLAAAGAGGLDATEASEQTGVKRIRVSSSLQALAASGRAFTRRIGRFYRYFETQALADAWVQPPKPVKQKEPRQPRQPRQRKSRAKPRESFVVVAPKPSNDQPVKVKNHGRPTLSGPIVIPEDVKRTVCLHYTHDVRYPGPEFVGPRKPVFSLTGASLQDCYRRSAELETA